MYVFLGQDTVIRSDEIIGIFDPDNTTVSKITRDMLRKSEKNGELRTVGFEIPKSMILCADEQRNRAVILSPITPATLTKRIQSGQTE